MRGGRGSKEGRAKVGVDASCEIMLLVMYGFIFFVVCPVVFGKLESVCSQESRLEASVVYHGTPIHNTKCRWR